VNVENRWESLLLVWQEHFARGKDVLKKRIEMLRRMDALLAPSPARQGPEPHGGQAQGSPGWPVTV
jgi:hypothetical protein